jgi:hypothetical protein
MAKNTILGDTFEQLAELGASTIKQTVKAVGQIVNPFDQAKTQEIKRGQNHTPVDFDKLKNNFQNKDKQKADAIAQALKNRLFQMVKREDEKIIERKEMKEKQKERDEENEVYEKRRREQQRKQAQQQDDIPTGKGKRGVATRKKTSEQQHVENKPASGKQ